MRLPPPSRGRVGVGGLNDRLLSVLKINQARQQLQAFLRSRPTFLRLRTGGTQLLTSSRVINRR